jgi:hypothetical protein
VDADNPSVVSLVCLAQVKDAISSTVSLLGILETWAKPSDMHVSTAV